MSLQIEGEKEEKRFTGVALQIVVLPSPTWSLPRALTSPTWSLLRALKATRVRPCHLPVREAILCKTASFKNSQMFLLTFQ